MNASARPILLAIAALALASSLSRLLPDLPKLATPGKLEVVRLHEQSRALARQAGLRPGAKVATLSPVFALEAGLEIYPEFGAGPFVYRVAPVHTARRPAQLPAVSPAALASFLDSDPPAAILLETAEPPDLAFAAYAAARAYRQVGAVSGKNDAPFRLLIRHATADNFWLAVCATDGETKLLRMLPCDSTGHRL